MGSSKLKIALLISGRGSNMEAIIEQCQTGILQEIAAVVLVFSNNPIAKGLKIASKKDIKTATIDTKKVAKDRFDIQLLALLRQHRVEWIVLAGYMRILSPTIIAAYPQRIVNIHPADTNLHQGLGGYQWAFDNNLRSTKITVHYVSQELDKGEVVAQIEVDLEGVTSVEEVEQRGLTVEHQFYSQVLRKLWK